MDDLTPLPVDDDGELTRLHPNYKTALRLHAALVAVPVVIASVVIDRVLSSTGEGGWPLPFGTIIGVVVFFAALFVIRIPSRRWNARGYQISDDRLRVVRGVMWRHDTVVPFGRVQHIDVDQGPLDRAFGIASLTLHTAGSHNASVVLPGLGLDLANTMREDIRAHIRRESM